MKFRLTVTAVHEYEVHPENYGVDDVEEMLVIDRLNTEDDPFLSLGEDADWTAKVELVEE